MSAPSERLMRRAEAAQYLRERYGLPVSEKSLAKRAVYGTGPRFRKYGRHPLYSPADLDAYVAEALSAPTSASSQQH